MVLLRGVRVPIGSLIVHLSEAPLRPRPPTSTADGLLLPRFVRVNVQSDF
jgi:hypothetical protein